MYIAFSISFLSSLVKKLINFCSKQYEPFLNFRRALVWYLNIEIKKCGLISCIWVTTKNVNDEKNLGFVPDQQLPQCEFPPARLPKH